MMSRQWPTALRLLALVVAVVVGLLWLRRSRRVAPPIPSDVSLATAPPARAATTLHGLMEKRTPSAQIGVHVDLYLPASAARTPPLMVFVEGGRWSMPDEKTVLGASVADAMQRRGIAVAWLTFELGEAYSLLACAADVTAVLRDLAERAETHQFDRSRITLVGYGMGASLAAMIGLDRGEAGDAAADAARDGGARLVQRVVGIRGTYDYSDASLANNPDQALFLATATTAEARVAASPVARVRADAPAFMLLGASDDGAEWAMRAHAFMRALERAGSRDVQLYLAPSRDARSILSWGGEGNEVAELVSSFVASGPTPLPIDGPWGAKQRWTSTPPLDHQAFWADEELVVTRPIDARFNEALALVLQGVTYELHVLPGKEYRAVPLGAYLDARAPGEIGRGEHLVVTNIRGEQLHLTRADLQRHAPLLVIGIDDERNLYRLFTSYRLKREYSWRAGDAPAPPTMIRPTGPFLFFPGGVPVHLANTTLAPYGLTPSSFRFVEKDPLASVRGLKKELREALAGREGCLKCHTLRGEGARSHHVRAVDGAPHGGFALPLEEYAPDVLHRFLFDQEAVAESFGVGPLKIAEPTAKAIEELVAKK